jgi:lambda repressor-like predicted transcriptional regulator
MTSFPTFNDVRERTLWVQAELRRVGSSFSAIARENGWSRGAVANAMFVASDPQEKAIADKLGGSQQELFPERYDRLGERLHPVRQNTAGRGAGNVKNSEAA